MKLRVPEHQVDLQNNGTTLRFPVFKSAAGTDLLNFLQQRLPANHAQQLPVWLDQQQLFLNNIVLSANTTLHPGQTLSLHLPDHHEAPVQTDWHIIWQNHELMVVYKPPLLPVSRTTRNLYHTLISLVRRETEWHQAQLLHRLDTETDGLILLAKNRTADRKWKPKLNELLLHKRYHARVYGRPAWQHQQCVTTLAERPDNPIRCQMFVGSDQSTGKLCQSYFTCLAQQQYHALIECTLVTGRRHQIRAQLAHLGHPIVADKIYAHQGRYFLKRLADPLTEQDYSKLGGDHHQLTAVAMTLRPDPEQAPVDLTLPDHLNKTYQYFLAIH
ncbi:RluA family pseudouridine synthase [Pontibacter sp. JAM-7]|uniref:RluA family pseudouridine synthase n=1 Tax=Pontibacter sp. JAM-7 TaxID=3366581 RepID=UPI003AF7BF38